ncbi:MAG: NDP-sugar synthase [Gemmatimonadales bacterium]
MPDAMTLLVLAAGMGSRYGGMKQLDPVGPGGEVLMDYSVFDAVRNGFKRVVFVIRPDMDSAFRDFVRDRYGNRIGLGIAHQRLEDVPAGARVPPGRAKPWGTAHAVFAARQAIEGPFAVVNADDFYGLPAFEAVRAWQPEAPAAVPEFAVVGYRLGDTLSGAGGVNRGLLRSDDAGWLVAVEEVVGIAPPAHAVPSGDGSVLVGRSRGEPVRLGVEDVVSMNLWAFTPAVFPLLAAAFEIFLATADLARDELLIPTVLQRAITEGRARVRVLDPRSPWHGMTYPADRPPVAAALAELAASGRYPARLWP